MKKLASKAILQWPFSEKRETASTLAEWYPRKKAPKYKPRSFPGYHKWKNYIHSSYEGVRIEGNRRCHEREHTFEPHPRVCFYLFLAKALNRRHSIDLNG